MDDQKIDSTHDCHSQCDDCGCDCGPSEKEATNPVAGRIDRRGSLRRDAKGSAVGVFDEPGEGKLVTRVDLLDASVGGLGLSSLAPIPLGVELKLHFNGQMLPGRSGRVVRCSPDGDAWRIGLACNAVIAAAG